MLEKAKKEVPIKKREKKANSKKVYEGTEDEIVL